MTPSFSLPPLNDGRRASHLDLSRRATGETPAGETEPGPDAWWLASLDAARTQVEPFDFEVLRARAARLAVDPPPPVPAAARPVWRWLGMGLALLGASVVLVAPPGRSPGGLLGAHDPPTTGESAATEGLKGGLPHRDPKQDPGTELTVPTLGALGAVSTGSPGELSFVVQRDGKRVRGGQNTVLQDGDLIAFRCFAAQFEEVVLTRVAADGTVSPLDPVRGYTPYPLQRYQRVDIEGYEQVSLPLEPLVVAFFGPWAEAQIRAAVGSAWAAGGADTLVEWADRADNIDTIQLR